MTKTHRPRLGKSHRLWKGPQFMLIEIFGLLVFNLLADIIMLIGAITIVLVFPALLFNFLIVGATVFYLWLKGISFRLYMVVSSFLPFNTIAISIVLFLRPKARGVVGALGVKIGISLAPSRALPGAVGNGEQDASFSARRRGGTLGTAGRLTGAGGKATMIAGSGAKGASKGVKYAGKGVKYTGKGIKAGAKAAGAGIKAGSEAVGGALGAIPVVGTAAGAIVAGTGAVAGTGVQIGGAIAGKTVEAAGKTTEIAGKVGEKTSDAVKKVGKGVEKTGKTVQKTGKLIEDVEIRNRRRRVQDIVHKQSGARDEVPPLSEPDQSNFQHEYDEEPFQEPEVRQ